MPRTRRQLASFNEKENFILPIKNNTLIIPQRDGLERLPTTIFQMIQTYLTNEEYKNLMNCNVSTFQMIKFETFHYRLKGPELWYSIDSIPDKKKESYFLQFLNNKVKDKSKQITVIIHKITLSLLLSHIHLFKGIYRLKIKGINYIKNNNHLDFNVFNNIQEVILQTIKGIKTISIGFNHIQSLELIDFPDLISISNINNNNTLKKLRISHCPEFQSIDFPFNSIIHFEIICCKSLQLPSSFHFNELKHLVIYSTPLDMKTILQLSPILPTLLSFSLSSKLPAEFNDFHLFQNIPKLHYDQSTSSGAQPFPLFYGKALYLLRANLTGWESLSTQNTSNLSFNTIQRLELSSCKGLINFPVMSELQFLEINHVSDIQVVPSLVKLKHLVVIECKELVLIDSFQPSLQKAELERCYKLTDLSFAGHPMRSLKIASLSRLTDISMLSQVKWLEIDDCDSITSVVGLSGTTSVENDQRTVKLSSLKNVTDASSLHQINCLKLLFIDSLTDLAGLHDINHLTIQTPRSLVSTKGLYNIYRSFTLHFCSALTELIDIGGIPVITINFCQKIVDYSHLRDHKKVIIKERTFKDIEKVKNNKSFQKDVLRSIVFETTV
eukprot:gene10723-11682_t